MASSVACSRPIIACSRPGGVSGKAFCAGQEVLNTALAFVAALRTSSSRDFCSALKPTFCWICANGQAVMPLPGCVHNSCTPALLARGPGCGSALGICLRRALLAPEHPVEEVVIGIGPEAVVIAVGPERVVENIGIGIGPEYRPVPRHETCALSTAPGPLRSDTQAALIDLPIGACSAVGEGRRKATLPSHLRRHACGTVAARSALRLRIGLDGGVRLHTSVRILRVRILSLLRAQLALLIDFLLLLRAL